MASFTISEDLWVRNYSRLIVVKGNSTLKLALISLTALVLDVLCVVLHQYIGFIFITWLYIFIIRRYWFNKQKAARRVYRAEPLSKLIQEVIFAEDTISIIFDGAFYKLSWDGLIKVINLPDVLYIKHKYLDFYVLKSALSEDEGQLLTRKLNNLQIPQENRK